MAKQEVKGRVFINLSSRAGTKIENVFLNWAINTGKIIIVFTELIALGALAYRFVVDKQIIDLHDQITRENTLLKGLAPKEQEYRNLQTRISQVKLITADAQIKINVMNNILTAINNGNFSSTNLSVNQDVITLEGDTVSVFALNAFITSLQQYPNIQAISVDDLESSDQGIKFRVFIDVKQNEPTNS